MAWGDETNFNYQDTKLVVWTFRTSRKVKNGYHIEQLYGEVKPRLMCNKADPQLWSNLQCSRSKTSIYEECVWTVSESHEDDARDQVRAERKQRRVKSPVK